jgi:biofilm protein TabA
MTKYLQLILLLLMEAFLGSTEGLSQTDSLWTREKSEQWCKSKVWAEGLKPNVFSGVNVVEFAKQFNKNKALWVKAFDFLKNTKFDTCKAGKYYLMGDIVYVTIMDNKPKSLDETKWEAHRKYIDVQYVFKGMEKMGVAPVLKATEVEPYSEKKDIGFYSVPEKDCKYYVARQDSFLIFFPSDAHRPNIKISGYDSDKKIVIKIKAD